MTSQTAVDGPITQRLAALASAAPDRELVVDPVFGRTSYGEAAALVDRLALGLKAQGLGPGDIVILQLPNWAPFLWLHLALTRIGAVTATIPIVYREREMTSLLALTEAKALVVPGVFHGFDYAALADRLKNKAPGLERVFVVDPQGESARPGQIAYDRLLDERGEGGDLDGLAPGPDDMTALGFTSGTSGDLKGVIFSTRVLAATNRGLAERYGLNEQDRIFGCSPLGHAVGFTHALRMTLTIGGTIVLQQRWEPDQALRLIRDEGCSFMACATPFLMDLVYHPSLAAHGSLESLRLFLCGGASIPRQLLRDAQAALPKTFVTPLWGMTECGGVTTCPFDAPAEKLVASDGLPCDNMELKVVGPDGETLPPGEDGELMARGEMLTLGYYRQPELTGAHYQEDGFFRTGDQARMDAEGYVKITGRIKDLIIRGGVNISPVEIESVLFAHPRVANAAVVGMPDDRLGERICAYVVLAEGESLELAEVQAWMAEAGLAKQKWPEHIELVDALPMTPSGKVQKFRLRERIAARLGEEGQAESAA